MSRLVGVDIGASAVRVVEVAGVDADGMAVITRLGVCPLPDGAVNAGRIRSPKDVSVALVRALREAGVSRQGFIVGMTTPDVALTTQAFPAAVRQNERESAIRAMNRSISPTFSLENSALATYQISQTIGDDGTATLTLGIAACLAEDLELLQLVCESARCFPRAIDLTGAALLRSLTRVNPLSGEIGTVVDVGASKVTVATRQGMFLRSLRTTVGGGADITRALAAVTRESMDEAEARKLAMKLTSGRGRSGGAAAGMGYGIEDEVGLDTTTVMDPSGMLTSTLSTSVDMLVDTIAQSVEADAANHGSMTQGVSLCGGTALLRGFKDRLQTRLGVPVNIGRPWADLERSKRNAANFVEGRADPRLLLSLAPAVGLALWREPA